jgi:membrane associated rhomboid family serine protease
VSDEPDIAVRRPWATMALIAANIAVALGMIQAGSSPWYAGAAGVVEAGGVDASLVWGGEVWRLFTGCFVHVGVWHLAMNLWVLWQVGSVLEAVVGWARFSLIYVASGIFGFAASVALQPGITAGASGAVFGVVGALLGIALAQRHLQHARALGQGLIPFVAGTLALGFLVPMVDNTAHVGGLLLGFLLTFGLISGERTPLLEEGRVTSSPPRTSRAAGMGALVAALLLFAAVVPYALRPVLSPRYHTSRGLLALTRGDVDKATAHADTAARLAPGDSVPLVLQGRLADLRGKPADAMALYDEALRRADEADPEAAATGLARALNLLSDGDSDVPFSDPATMNALCDAALRRLGEGSKAMALLNNCAWLKLTAGPPVHDPARALALAEDAVRAGGENDATILHTLAEALSQNGVPDEAARVLEKAIAERVDGADSAFIRDERRRFAGLAEAARLPGPTSP